MQYPFIDLTGIFRVAHPSNTNSLSWQRFSKTRLSERTHLRSTGISTLKLRSPASIRRSPPRQLTNRCQLVLGTLRRLEADRLSSYALPYLFVDTYTSRRHPAPIATLATSPSTSTTSSSLGSSFSHRRRRSSLQQPPAGLNVQGANDTFQSSRQGPGLQPIPGELYPVKSCEKR